jgi:CDP-paratose 2-epimerase
MTQGMNGRTNGLGSGQRSSKHAQKIGLLEWFRIGEYEQVEQVLIDLKHLGVEELRTGISWADWHTGKGEGWYQWLLPRLAREVNVLPCFLYTPPSLGIVPKTSAPPRIPKAYADFIDVMITRFGKYFEWVELWNEPTNISEWDWTIDPSWQVFAEMIGGAAYWVRQRGKKTVLAGMSPIDPNWLQLMIHQGVIDYIDVVGIHGFPGTWEQTWEGWEKSISRLRAMLDQHGSKAEIWITEAGFSTWQHNEYKQIRTFLDVLESPAERVYWYSLYDLDPNFPTIDGFHLDEREYHFGLKRVDGTPKLMFRLWEQGGLQALRDIVHLSKPAYHAKQEKFILITGGAGFVGTNLAKRLLEAGEQVLLFDNLSRPGVEKNLRWLRKNYGDQIQIEVADMRNQFAVHDAVRQAKQVFHLAAQVAVTTSLTNPVHDFGVNAQGTLNLLEALRRLPDPPPLVFTSTNKVYGDLQDVALHLTNSRYEPVNQTIKAAGIAETHLLDFHSPYGCSKGTADQYVSDYARIYDLPTIVFRMSCIYGPHQFGTEDQGWVAHFLIRTLKNEPITLYGDGKQVRDILYVDDLIDAFLLAQANMATLSGQAFNIGGGPANTVSLLELIDLIEKLHGRRPHLYFDDWRPGDQRYYVSDIRKFQQAAHWTPRFNVKQGLRNLYEWLQQEHKIEKSVVVPAIAQMMAK